MNNCVNVADKNEKNFINAALLFSIVIDDSNADKQIIVVLPNT